MKLFRQKVHYFNILEENLSDYLTKCNTAQQTTQK